MFRRAHGFSPATTSNLRETAGASSARMPCVIPATTTFTTSVSFMRSRSFSKARSAAGSGVLFVVVALLLLSVGAFKQRDTPSLRSDSTSRAIAGTRYTPRSRTITITTVPLLVKEQTSVLAFLKEDFAKGGVLDGKEVYGFSPSSVTVVEGDTVHFTFINPEDDLHTFVLPDLVVALPPQKITTATYVARRAGIYPFVCSVKSHLPMMSGQLIVLPGAMMR
jgi:plastocyanin